MPAAVVLRGGCAGWGPAAGPQPPSPLAWDASVPPHAEEASAEHPSPLRPLSGPGLPASAGGRAAAESRPGWMGTHPAAWAGLWHGDMAACRAPRLSALCPCPVVPGGAQGAAVGGSGCHWVLTTSLLPQDYTDTLMTNYCVSGGGSRRQVHPPPRCCAGCVPGRAAAPGSSAPLSPTLGAAAGSAGRPERLGRGGHGTGVLAGPLHHRLLLCPDLATGADRKLLLRAAEAQVVPRPWPRLLGSRSPWLWTCPLCPQAGCGPVRCHCVELLPLLESKSAVREKPRPLPVPSAA